ncbi:MAG: FAD-dependent monooxygenase [Methyloceanibacter sp.]|nr:FAD-dependent monooxygenase [Methyloceanibacter sp.]
MTTPQAVLIAGGGIGGLATAIALDRKDIEAHILERSNFAEESGAGIQLGPNATRVLRRLGVLDALEPQTFRPRAVWLFDGRTGKKLATVPLGDVAEERYGAPYVTAHRADLHEALRIVAADAPHVMLTSNATVTGIREDDGVSITGSDGMTWQGCALVGADGIWSTVRRWVAPDAIPAFTGATAFRSLTPRDSLPEPFSLPIVGLWLGPRTHLVHYPVRGGAAVNIVAVTEAGEKEEGWNNAVEQQTVLANFSRWTQTPIDLLDAAPAWRAWSLFALPAFPTWSRGRTTLLGDAAHPVLPYLAQGAGLAIEDAATLAELLQQIRAEPTQAFATYETIRRPRATRVQVVSKRLGRAYHLGDGVFSDLIRVSRNAILGLRGEEATLRGFDWLYGEPNRSG